MIEIPGRKARLNTMGKPDISKVIPSLARQALKLGRTKCRKCLKGARISITGLDKNILRMDMGGAVLYLTPKEDGKMEVALNSENLIDGDYAFATWTGNKWLVD